jgi:pyruvate/2-oxoglutarate/acetoin dehydrogenase E1 component
MKTVLDSLNGGLHSAFTADPNVLLLGEDVLDPYGGAFKVTRGLSTAFPDRVLAAPISEAGMVGTAAGMALRGLRPVVEIMFGDFVSLAADQLVNHAAKFRWMYNDQVRVPMVVRTPMGGGRGYGPTHSQSLEKVFMGVPGLRVAAPASPVLPGFPGAGDLLARLILETEDPVLFIENKRLYPLALQHQADLPELVLSALPGSRLQSGPACLAAVAGAPPASLTITAYGYMAALALRALPVLAYDDEIFAELVILTQLAPFEIEAVLESTSRTGRLLTVEEAGLTMGWGAEILARTAQALGPGLRNARRLAGMDLPVPASRPLEEASLPDEIAILQAARQMLGKLES